jgi:glyoxylase-like metal-dependent hydrolase (beta-lactamase superfamily II)
MATVIHPLRTGTVTVKEALRRGRGRGPRRRTAALTDRAWTERLPIHCWLIDHADGPILVDSGPSPTTPELPFVRYAVERDDEVDRALARVGVAADDLRAIVLTHAHGDHVDGLARLPTDRVTIGEEELRLLRRPAAAAGRRLLGIPLPEPFSPAPLRFAPEPFGAFERSAALTADGSVVAVPTPGHTPGHISVIVVIDGRHHFLAGDATYDQAQLLALRVDGIAPRGRPARDTMRRILAHAAQHPTVYLPTHDTGSADRLRAGEVLRPG